MNASSVRIYSPQRKEIAAYSAPMAQFPALPFRGKKTPAAAVLSEFSSILA